MRGWGRKAQTSFSLCYLQVRVGISYTRGWFVVQSPAAFHLLVHGLHLLCDLLCPGSKSTSLWQMIIGCLHSHLQQTTWNQKVQRRQSTHCRIDFTPHDLTDTEKLILKKEMAALEEGRVCAPCTLMHFQEPDSQPACAASRQSVAQLWCFFNTAAVHFLRHVDYPWFQLRVSTQDVCSKQHAMLRTTPVWPSERCGGEHCGHQLRFCQRRAFEKYSLNIMHRKVEDISQP